MIETNHYVYSVIMLLSVIFVKYIIQSFSPHNCMLYFQLYCDALANKVNKPSNTSQQKKISGFVAIIVTLLPLWLILWLFADFMAVQELWDGLLLYLALSGITLNQNTKKITNSLNNNKKEQAKVLLQPLVLRNTNSLSVMGISKASIEMLVLKSLQGIVCVGFYFLLFGPLTALCFRLLLEMHYCWNIKRDKFKSFGASINTVASLLQWIPARMLAVLFLLQNAGPTLPKALKAFFAQFFKLNNNILLSLIAIKLNIQVAGVAMYDGNKLRRDAFNNTGSKPNITDIAATRTLISITLAGCIFMIVISAYLSA